MACVPRHYLIIPSKQHVCGTHNQEVIYLEMRGSLPQLGELKSTISGTPI